MTNTAPSDHGDRAYHRQTGVEMEALTVSAAALTVYDMAKQWIADGDRARRLRA
jgi:hypothetical protein